MAVAPMPRQRRESGWLAFNLTGSCFDERWYISSSGEPLALEPGIGFSGTLNPILALPEAHSHCIYAHLSDRNELC